jgi:hypothetical protein
MNEIEQEVATKATETAPAKSKTPTSKTVAVVFDSTRKSQGRRGLLGSTPTGESNFSAIVVFAPLPTEDDNGSELAMSIKDSDKVKLTYGTNMAIDLRAWTAQNSSRFKTYEKGGAFEVYKPRRGREANGYFDFEETDAIGLVLGTVSIAQLDRFSEGETREEVLKAVREQKAAIQSNLDAKKARNESSAMI